MIKMKSIHVITILVILAVSFSISQFVSAQSSQNAYTISLTYLTIQLSYPSQVLPGDAVTVNIQATAKSNINSVILTAQVYYANGADLHQLTSATVNGNYMPAGSNLSKQIQFTIPQDAPRTSLLGVLTEKVQTVYTSYYYYPMYSNHSSPYCYNDAYWSYDCYYNQGNYSYAFYPYSSYDSNTDSGVAPLSYVKAATPEYVSLQSQYQSLQSQYQTLQQQLAQSQGQNQQLSQTLQNAQNTIAQLDATIANLNQQINSTQNTNRTLEAIAAALGVVSLLLGAAAVHEHRGKSELKPQSNEDGQSNL